MERSGHGMLNGSLYPVSCQSCSEPLSEARRASPIISWMMGQLSDSCPRNHASDRSFPESRMPPVFPVRRLQEK
jgi:hypothetical protein